MEIKEIIAQFPQVGKVAEVKQLTSGWINRTYIVKSEDPNEVDYILQRVNHNVFQNIDLLQHNIEVVTAHIRAKLEAQKETDCSKM